MKRPFFAIFSGLIFLSLFIILSYFFPYLSLYYSSYMTLQLLLAGILTGYIARTKGFIYGAITGFVAIAAPAIIISLVLAYFIFILQAEFRGEEPLTNILKEFYKTIPPAIIVGSIGGIIGEYLYNLRRKVEIKRKKS